MVKMLISLVPMVQMLQTNGTIGRTPDTRINIFYFLIISTETGDTPSKEYLAIAGEPVTAFQNVDPRNDTAITYATPSSGNESTETTTATISGGNVTSSATASTIPGNHAINHSLIAIMIMYRQ